MLHIYYGGTGTSFEAIQRSLAILDQIPESVCRLQSRDSSRGYFRFRKYDTQVGNKPRRPITTTKSSRVKS
jgi:hypothetical protein